MKPLQYPKPPTSKPALNALAMACALVGAAAITSFVPHSAYAQETAAQQHYAIPAGNLSDVLAQFAATAGVPLSFEPQMLAGMQSSGLQGRYTVQEGFATLLNGSGYQLVSTGSGGYSLQKIPTDVTTLPAINVSGAALNTSTEATGAYTMTETSTATKLKLTPRQTPQIVNAVTHQMIEDFGMTEMEDVLSLAPGVSVGHTDDDRRSFTARGYAMSIQYDGLPSTSGIDGGVVAGPDSALIDRTEVLLGAAGLMSGAGQPGGVINMIFKRPTADFQGAASLTAGSWETQRMMADLSGPLSTEGAVRGRVVAVDQSEESFRDFKKERKKVFYAVVESDLTETTLLTLSIQNQDIYDNVTDRSGLPTDNDGRNMDWSRSTFLAPAWNRWNKYATTYKVRLQQELAADWQLTVQGSALKSEADWLFATLSEFDSTTGEARFARWGQYNKETSDDLEIFSSGPVTLFGRSHEIVLGGNWTERVWNGRDGDGTDYTTNLYDFDPITSIPQPELVLDTRINDQITEQYGGYLAGHFNFTDRLAAILGARLSWYRYEFGDTAREEDEVVTPYAGVTYELNEWASVYASHTDIFNPQSARGTDGNTLEPEVGVSQELGLKGEFFEGRLNASAVLFKIQKDNEAELLQPYDATNICGGWCYAPKGETITDGIDLSLSGQVTRELQVMAGFTQYEKDDNDETVNIAKFSASYAPVGQDWSAGISIDASSKSYGQWGMSQEARTLVGMFGKYQLNPYLNLALNGYNLLDEKYYANAIDSGYGNQYWGEPRSWALTLQAKW